MKFVMGEGSQNTEFPTSSLTTLLEAEGRIGAECNIGYTVLATDADKA